MRSTGAILVIIVVIVATDWSVFGSSHEALVDPGDRSSHGPHLVCWCPQAGKEFCMG